MTYGKRYLCKYTLNYIIILEQIFSMNAVDTW